MAGSRPLLGSPFVKPHAAARYSSPTTSPSAAHARARTSRRSEHGSEGSRSTSVVRSDSGSEGPPPLTTTPGSGNWLPAWCGVSQSTHSDASSDDASSSSEEWGSASECPTVSSTGAEYGSASSSGSVNSTSDDSETPGPDDRQPVAPEPDDPEDLDTPTRTGRTVRCIPGEQHVNDCSCPKGKGKAFRTPLPRPANGGPNPRPSRPNLPRASLFNQPERHPNAELPSNAPGLPPRNQASSSQQDSGILRLSRPILPTNNPFREIQQPGLRNVAWGYFYRSRLSWLVRALANDRAHIEPYSNSIAEINEDIRMALETIILMAQRPEFLCDAVFLWRCRRVIRDVQGLREEFYKTLEYIRRTRALRARHLLDEQYERMIDRTMAQMLEMVRSSYSFQASHVFDLVHFRRTEHEKKKILWAYQRRGKFCSEWVSWDELEEAAE